MSKRKEITSMECKVDGPQDYKYFGVPASISMDCPVCGSVMDIDFTNMCDGGSTPEYQEPWAPFGVECEQCGKETIDAVIELTAVVKVYKRGKK